MSNSIKISKIYIPTDNTISVDKFITLSLSQLNKYPECYITFSYNDKPLKVIELMQFLLDIPNLNTEVTTLQLLEQNVTDLVYDGLDYLGDHENKTLNILDPFATNNMCVQYGNFGSSVIENDDYEYYRDLIITLDGNLSPNNCLVWVNGVFHKSITVDNTTIDVLDGYINMQRCGKKSLLLVNTDELGGHTITNITKDNVFIDDVSKDWYLRFDNTTFSEGTVLLIIDGTLYTTIHDTYNVLSDNTIKIKPFKIDLINQLRHNPNLVPHGTLPTIDIKTPYPSILNDEDMSLFCDDYITSHTYLNSKDFLINRLTSTQSCVITINNPNIVIEENKLVSNNNPNIYSYHGLSEPNGILCFNHIHQLPYTLTKDMVANIVPTPTIEKLKDYKIIPSYLLYVNPDQNCDDLYLQTRDNKVYISTYMDHETPRISPNTYLLSLTSYIKTKK